MANNGPLKDLECFIPPIDRKSEFNDALRVLEEKLAYDEESTVTERDMDLELEMEGIIERDVHLCEMNRTLRDRLSNRIHTIKNVADKDYEELMEDFRNKSQKKMIGDYMRLTEEESPDIVLIQKDENEGGIGFISLTLDHEGTPIPRAMPEWMLTATLTRDNRLVRKSFLIFFALIKSQV